MVGEVIKVWRGGKWKTREETDEEEEEEEEEKENVRKKWRKTEEAEREEREWRARVEWVLTRMDEREQQREVQEGQRVEREKHMVKVADWVAAMISDVMKRVREWDTEWRKAETGSSGSEETERETENGEKVEWG